MAKIFSQAQMDEIYAYFKDKMNSLECILKPEIKPFNTCTWEDIIATVNLYYEGIHNLDDIKRVWNMGDSISLSISNIDMKPSGDMQTDSGYYTVTFGSQTVEMMIIDFAHDTLVTPINGKTKALLTLGTKDCLNNVDYYETNNYWRCYPTGTRYRWYNECIKKALPNDVKSIIKKVTKSYQSSNNNQQTTSAQLDVFLPTAIEMGASSPTDHGGVLVGGNLYAYFLETANRKKKVNDTYSDYWTASNDSYTGSKYIGYQTIVKSDGSIWTADRYTKQAGFQFAFCI